MITIKSKFERTKTLETKTNLVFSTKEDLDSLVIAQMLGADGFLLFSVDEIKREVEKAARDKKIGMNERGFSKSQILRGTMSSLWMNSSGISFEEFYNKEMDKIINHYKSKIDG